MTPGFGGVIFRRETPQITNEGGLWDESKKLYRYLGAEPRENSRDWTFPTGTRIRFAHLQMENDVHSWQGAQIAYIGFDELTHFTRYQFFYMLSRNRSTSGVRPYVRATCNPDPESWVYDLIGWWVGEDGYPIPERSGVVRWFQRIDDTLFWGDTPDDLYESVKDRVNRDDFAPTSLTFIPARLEDNPALIKADPDYRAKLLALDAVERDRLLGGNWKTKPAPGLYFRREWFEIVDAADVPASAKRVRWWDLAATEPGPENRDPDWTVGALLAEHDGRYWIVDIQRFRKSTGTRDTLMQQTAQIDGVALEQGVEQEPGSAGKAVVEYLARTVFKGHTFTGIPSTGDKVTRAGPFSSAVEKRLVRLVRGDWNRDFLYEAERFPSAGTHDDQIDACSGAFAKLGGRRNGLSFGSVSRR